MKTLAGIVWWVLTWRLIVQSEAKMMEHDVLFGGGSQWYRVWASAFVEGKVEGYDYVDVLADDAEIARVMASQILPEENVAGYVPSLCGSADLFRMMDRISSDRCYHNAREDWGLDDEVTPVSKK